MSSTPRIILGSASRWRRQLFDEWGFRENVSTTSADIDEKAIRDPDPVALTLKLAHAKADAIISQGKIPNDGKPSLLICADQVIVCNGTIREKPENEEQARFYLRSYKDYPAEAVDAVVVVNTATGQRWEGVATGKIFWKEIPESKIDELIAKGDIFSCAGGFVVEQLRDYIINIEGDVSIMMGFPKELTLKLLSEAQATC